MSCDCFVSFNYILPLESMLTILYFVFYSLIITTHHHAMRPIPPRTPRTISTPKKNMSDRCHTNGGPMDHKLKCDSSRHQIVLRAKQNQPQKRNLIIFDIDFTILEAAEGWPLKLDVAKCPFCQVHGKLDLELVFIGFIMASKTWKYSLVFRRQFFDFLVDIHTNSGYSADLVLYTECRPDYAKQVAFGIDECFKRKYHNMSGTDFVFKMVVSSTTPGTAKTVSTLEYFLELRRYESIIILDDNGRNSWCKYHMMQLKKHHKVNFILIQVPKFNVWEEANHRFKELSSWSRERVSFTKMVTGKQYKDNLFYHFGLFLNALHQNESHSVLFDYAKPIRDMSHSNRLGALMWWQWYMFEYGSAMKYHNSTKTKGRALKRVTFFTYSDGGESEV